MLAYTSECAANVYAWNETKMNENELQVLISVRAHIIIRRYVSLPDRTHQYGFCVTIYSVLTTVRSLRQIKCNNYCIPSLRSYFTFLGLFICIFFLRRRATLCLYTRWLYNIVYNIFCSKRRRFRPKYWYTRTFLNVLKYNVYHNIIYTRVCVCVCARSLHSLTRRSRAPRNLVGSERNRRSPGIYRVH